MTSMFSVHAHLTFKSCRNFEIRDIFDLYMGMQIKVGN